MADIEKNGLLRPEFVEGLKKFKDFIVNNTPTKYNLNSTSMKPMRGYDLSKLIESYVAEMNKSGQDGGAIPSINSAWDNLV